MVKTSVDFASEAPRCQRISSIIAQITFGWATMVDAIIGFFSMERFAAKTILTIFFGTLDSCAPYAAAIVDLRHKDQSPRHFPG